MITRRSLIQLGGLALAAPSVALGNEYLQFGPMYARYVGEADAEHVWAFRSSMVDTVADLSAAPEYHVHVVLPSSYPANAPYPALFVAPPGPQAVTNNLKGIALAKTLGLQDIHDCVLVTTTFKTHPRYGTHADGSRANDKHIIRSLWPLVERQYLVGSSREDKLILGFSASAWGAISLILRNPQHFGYAAAWDGPWGIDFRYWLFDQAFGTREQFNRYDPSQIMASRKTSINDRERVWISAGSALLNRYQPFIDLLTQQSVPHRRRYLESETHNWGANWMIAGARAMFEMRAA